MRSIQTPKYSSPAPVLTGGWDDLDTCDHSVQFYADDTFLLDRMTRFFGSALGAGDAAVVLATPAHRAALEERLSALGLNLSLAAQQDRYVALDAAEVLASCWQGDRVDPARISALVNEIIARVRGAAGSDARIAVFGELVALLCEEGKFEAAIELERLWNEMAAEHGFTLLCAYPMRCFSRAEDGAALAEICAEHSRVVPAEDYTDLDDEQARLRAVALLQHKAQVLEREIEERRHAQQSLRLREAELADLLENALEGVQQVDAEGVVGWANRALLTLLGFAPDEYVGHPLREFFVDPGTFDAFWQKLMRREDVYDFPAELRGHDGRPRQVLIHANGLWSEGHFIHARCFVRDVTEHARMERELRERNQALRAAIVARDEFLSIAAHELKTPITSLRGFAQLLLRDLRRNQETAPERLGNALDVMEMQTGKLNHLVERLLDTAQIEAGKLRVEPVETDLVALLQSAIKRQRRVARHPIVFAGPERLAASLDPLRFEQVITNLLDNADRFSPPDGVVQVSLEQAGDEIRMAVRDEGEGIPAGQRERVFSRFHQGHLEHHQSGMGLGLYITREIVELHGGSVTVEDVESPGRGTRFVVALPALPRRNP